MLKKVILCPNPYRDHELTVAKEAKRILDSVHCPNVVCVPFRNEEKPEGYGLDIRPLQQELRGADMIIAFGGDGTILHLSKTAAHRDIPVLGVNLGSLGFMAELEQKELGRLGELMDEKYTVESRMMLDVSVVREGRVIYSNLALNEAVVTRGAVSRVIRLHIRTEQGRLLGELTESAHRAMGELCALLGIDRVIAVGEYARGIADAAHESAEWYPDAESAVDAARAAFTEGSVLLCKASHSMHLEKIVEELLKTT